MKTSLDINIANNYKNNSQKIRVITEFWVKQNGYCPNCGDKLSECENNRPVADFLCNNCKEEFELKSKYSKNTGKKIVDGTYYTMIERIKSNNNPNFLFLTYDRANYKINNFLIIPNFYFLPEVIEKRKPLSKNARRAGWIGCNILLQEIPESGRIYFVKNSSEIEKSKVLKNWRRNSFLKNKKGESKGWIIDVMNCIDRIDKEIFYLDDVYKFEKFLKEKHPNNNFVKDKIRQQLQLLRNKGIIKFLGNGKYEKVRT